MNHLKGKKVIVTGGSRGFGRGMVEVLATEGATVYALARNADHLDQLKREISGIQTCVADVRDPQVAPRILREIRPDILILNAGATPPMLPIQEQSWEQFGGVWETDVKATFQFGKEALLLPMKAGSVVMIVSSGAAIAAGSSPVAGSSALVGSFSSAKRMQWSLAQSFQEAANAMGLGIRFVVLVPRLTNQTELGQASLAVLRHGKESVNRRFWSVLVCRLPRR